MKLWFDNLCDTYRASWPGWANGRPVDDHEVHLGPPDDRKTFRGHWLVSADSDNGEILFFDNDGPGTTLKLKRYEGKVAINVHWRDE